MKTQLFTFFLLLTLNSTAIPHLQGYDFTPIMEFGTNVKARVSKDFFYIAEKLSDIEIKVSKYDLKRTFLSSEKINAMGDQNYYSIFSIIDFELGLNGEVLIIGQGNKSEQPKKQKCYLIHYVPDNSIVTKEIKDKLYLYKNLLFENGKFNFCAADGVVGDNYVSGIQRYGLTYNPISKEISSEWMPESSMEDLYFSGSFVFSKHFWYYGTRDMITRHSSNSLNIEINNRITFRHPDGSFTYYERTNLHQVELYDFSPFGEWFATFCSHSTGDIISEAYTSDGKYIWFENEIFQDLFIDPETKIPCIITTKGVYTVRLTYDQAVATAEYKMFSALSNWKKRGPLETESENIERISTYSQKFKDSILTLEFNKLLIATNIAVFPEVKPQPLFNSLRLKLTNLDDYFYTRNWNASITFQEPKLNKLIFEYTLDKPFLKGFDYTLNGIGFQARSHLPPEIIRASADSVKISDFEKRFIVEFKSKSANNSVRLLVDDLPVTPSIIALGNDRFQVSTPVKFNRHKAHIKMTVSCELGETTEEFNQTCEVIPEGKDCFSSYYKDLMIGFEKPSDLIEAINVCIIISNSNFEQLDSSAAPAALADNIKHATRLKNLLVNNYHYKDTNVILLEDLTYSDMQNLFNELERIDISKYYPNTGASKINLMLVVLSHGSENNKLITKDSKLFDIESAILSLNERGSFNKSVQDFLYLEHMCFGGFQKESKTLRGNKIDLNFKPDFCRYAVTGSKVGVMSSIDGNRVLANTFIEQFNNSLELNKDKEEVTLETILLSMPGEHPLLLKLYRDIENTTTQKSFYFFTDKYLQTKNNNYEN